MKKKIITGRLENWYNDPNHKIIWGNLYNDIHKRWHDGTRIHTSKIISQSSTHVKTLNSYYELGEPYKEADGPVFRKD